MTTPVPADFVAVTPDNGILKRVIQEGKGNTPDNGVTAVVHYVGTLYPTGEHFDSSRSRGKPFTFPLGAGRVIKGWDIGVKTMRPGEIAEFILAPDYAYGSQAVGNVIKANSTLKFEVEAIEFQ
ncbi:hypothetical protein BDF19DRAFT_416372 [Syncephalis fuscata]|nr:hypothetical protein BDF19DRAFT_416372 [Syncephalis fuscata]